MNAPSTRYGAVYWLDDCGDDLTRRPALAADETVDVAIVGGGFSGLWTAWFLMQAAPDLKVMVIEREFCGFGASGRNGGWCSPRYPVLLDDLERRFGAKAARATIRAQAAIVEDIGQICEHAGIDAHYTAGGLLSVARTERQWAGLKATYDSYARLGLAGDTRLLSADESAEYVRVSRVLGAMKTDCGASIHPARLARGLARAVEALGVQIVEDSAVARVRPGRPAHVDLANGAHVTARRAVVLAGEAYLSDLPGWQRQLLPVSSMIVATAPLAPEMWDAIGWQCHEGLSSGAYTKDYLTRTRDGRILFGSRGAPYLMGSRTDEAALANPDLYQPIIATLRDWFAQLADVPVTHCWGGYLGVPRDGMPSVHFDAGRGIANAFGYTGRGVATAALAGRALAGLIAEVPAFVPDLPMLRPPGRRWEPEPLRWIGVRYIQNAFARIDAADFKDGGVPIDAKIAKTLAPI